MSAPYEILAGPATIWLAAANTAEVAVDTAPGGSWTKLGTSGSDNYNEDGITVTHSQNIEGMRALGTTGMRKVWRTEEELTIELTLHDLTLEHYKRALNDNSITTTAAGVGTPGSKSISMLKGQSVALSALLLRTESQSPYGDSFNAQFWVPVCYQSDEPEVVFSKGEAAGLKLTFTALEDSSNGFGIYRAQTAAAS